MPAAWSPIDLVTALDGRVAHSTTYKYLAGTHAANPPESILQAFADVLPQASVVELRLAAGQQPGLEEPWRPPDAANRLSLEQRRALDNLIYAMVSEADRANERAAQAAARFGSDTTLDDVKTYVEQLKAHGGSQAVVEGLEGFLTTSSASDTTSNASSE